MKVLFDDPNFRVALYPLDKVIVATRKASDAGVDDVIASMRSALAVDVSSFGPHAMILDVRAVVGRNDADFEAATAEMRSVIARRSTRFVTLVATVAGALQTRRLASQSGFPMMVASSEEEAFRMARGESV
ncbi:MAG: hypothetical protein KC593_07790 [Myxococcales bacterium]|nr:hypothetical protein [Myxococcales bacterium]MCB9630318.1 hypothetical protein [Sandaracinaceae bacterium]